MAKRVSTRRIKANRHYPYEDAADVLGLSSQTVRSWRSQSLEVMTDKRPHIILGENLIRFIEARQKPASKMAPDQFRCMTCKRPTRPLDGVVFYNPLTPTRGQLKALCEECEGQCFRFASERGLPKLARFFEIVRTNESQA